MKKMRKGFTLVELLIVIAIIGILTAMGIIGGSEANNIAQATKIIEEFRTIGAAMNLYYADNRTAIEADTSFTADKIKTGLAGYTKATDSIASSTATSKVGKYAIDITTTPGQWWLSYTLPEANSKLAQILANKAQSEGLRNQAKDSTTTKGEEGKEDTTETNLYVASGETVYMRVR